MWAIDFLWILGMTSKKTLVRADSTLAESAGRGPPRDCSDLAALFAAIPDWRATRTILAWALWCFSFSRNFLYWAGAGSIGVCRSKLAVEQV